MLLIIDDDASFRRSLVGALTHQGYEVAEADSAAAGLEYLETHAVDLVLLDNHLGDKTGVEILPTLRQADESVDVILVTAYPEIRLAVEAMRLGAADFVVKPFELAELFLAVERVLETRRLRRELKRYEREGALANSDMLGDSPAMRELQTRITRIAPANAPVLICGETGTGKELVARALHHQSRRSSGPIVTVNCSAFSETLLESELFGHEKGAFTGAHSAREGVFEMANGGTLFLDEIGELRMDFQARLLRVVEGLPFHRLGGRREIVVDVRIVAATNRDLPAAIKAGSFREDLWFRLNALPIEMPPLRERVGDVALLAGAFLQRAAQGIGRPGMRLSNDAMDCMTSYAWPGNVRELRSVIDRLAILHDGDLIGPDALPPEIRQATPDSVHIGATTAAGRIPTLAELESAHVRDVLSRVDGNISEAARVLGVSRNTIRSRLSTEPTR